MTTNQQRAADLIEKATRGVADTRQLDFPSIAAELADAGLITPDLPTPDKRAATGNPVWWAPDTLGVSRYPDGEIGMMIDFESEARYTPETARAQALSLLAAADMAEEEA